MTEDEAMAVLRRINHPARAVFAVFGGIPIYLMEDDEPVAVIVPARRWDELVMQPAVSR